MTEQNTYWKSICNDIWIKHTETPMEWSNSICLLSKASHTNEGTQKVLENAVQGVLGIKPDISILKPWGMKCYVLNQGENWSKMDLKTSMALFMGISNVQGTSWWYYKPGVNRILHSCNISFLKHAKGRESTGSDTFWDNSVTLPT